jgi:hypothetical protein
MGFFNFTFFLLCCHFSNQIFIKFARNYYRLLQKKVSYEIMK